MSKEKLAELREKLEKLQTQIKTVSTKYNEDVEKISMMSKDGQSYEIEGEAKEGAAIFLVSESGSNPAPDGIVEMEDGSMVTIKDGKIEKIEDSPLPPAADPMSKEEMMAAMAEMETASPNDKMLKVMKALIENAFGWELREAQRKEAIELAKTMMSEVKEENKKLKNKIVEMQKEFANVNNNILETLSVQMAAMEEIANQPASKVETQKKVAIPKTVKGGPLSRI